MCFPQRCKTQAQDWCQQKYSKTSPPYSSQGDWCCAFQGSSDYVFTILFLKAKTNTYIHCHSLIPLYHFSYLPPRQNFTCSSWFLLTASYSIKSTLMFSSFKRAQICTPFSAIMWVLYRPQQGTSSVHPWLKCKFSQGKTSRLFTSIS